MEARIGSRSFGPAPACFRPGNPASFGLQEGTLRERPVKAGTQSEAPVLDAFQLFVGKGRPYFRESFCAKHQSFGFQPGHSIGFFSNLSFVEFFSEHGVIQFAPGLTHLAGEIFVLVAIGLDGCAKF